MYHPLCYWQNTKSVGKLASTGSQMALGARNRRLQRLDLFTLMKMSNISSVSYFACQSLHSFIWTWGKMRYYWEETFRKATNYAAISCVYPVHFFWTRMPKDMPILDKCRCGRQSAERSEWRRPASVVRVTKLHFRRPAVLQTLVTWSDESVEWHVMWSLQISDSFCRLRVSGTTVVFSLNENWTSLVIHIECRKTCKYWVDKF